MEEARFRGDNWSDPVGRAVAEEPGIKAVLEARRKTSHETMQHEVDQAIQDSEDRKLKAWVAVCVWEDEDGHTCHTVIGDDHSTFLELKGYLHDGVWAAAHAEP